MPTRPSHALRTVDRLGGALLALACLAGGAEGQVLRGGGDTVAVPVDSSDVLSRARREQARFERRRVRALPTSWGGGSGDCEEIVGRFCFWFADDGTTPPPEPDEVVDLRASLLAYFDSVQGILPRDGWITGQRVGYLVEAARWDDALGVARRCAAEPWWCAALRGLALHGLARYSEAEAAFGEALAAMEPEQAERWRDLDWLLHSDARSALREAEARDGPEARARLWTLADPLLLVPGNDRLTEHFARWTVSAIREEARSPFGISWGRDLEELTVRMGWEIAWEGRRDRGIEIGVVGHHHPDGRDFLPEGDAPLLVAEAEPEELQPDERRPRSSYAPALAPVVADMEGQIAAFPRGDEVVVVATHYLPDDTVGDAARDSLRAHWAAPGYDTLEARSGLFLISEDEGTLRSESVPGVGPGALVVRAPAGRYVVGVESWDPGRLRAGRARRGLPLAPVPPDVLTLSDLLLLRGGGGEVATLQQAAERALVRPEVAAGRPVEVAWELHGLGWAPAEIDYEVSVRKADVGLFRRLGQAVGLVDPQRPVAIRWQEPGPDGPGPVLRTVDLGLGGVEEGAYEVVLRADVSGRGTLTARTPLRVLASNVDGQGRPF